LLLGAAIGTSGLCLAQDMGRVLSSAPVMQQVAVPRQVCTTEQVEVQQQKSGAGAAMGAIAGGAMGNAVGRGAGNAAATVIGIIGGAIVGDRIEGAPPTEMRTVQRCGTQTFYENRPVAYNVVYEFGGKQYAVQMPNDPGPSIALQVSPVGASAPMAAPAPTIAVAPPVFVQAPVVVMSQPAYPVYYTRPYYPPISVELGYGYWGGYRGHHGHWR
jgi:uncharacterized protein YcfJ